MNDFSFSEIYKGYYILVEFKTGYYYFTIFSPGRKRIGGGRKNQSKTAYRVAKGKIENEMQKSIEK